MTARIASTWRRPPSSAGPVPGTSTTRIVAGVIFRAPTSAASCSSRSSAIERHADVLLAEAAAAGLRQGGEQRRLARARQPDDPDLERHLSFSSVDGDLLLQRDERAVLQRLDGALRLVEDRRRLGVREVEDELERQHLLLLLRERVDQLEHRLAPDRLERLVLRGALLGAERLRHLLLGLPAPVRAEVVHREVVRDPEEPGREGRRLEAELADRLEHAQERLGRQVLGVVPVPDGHVQIAVDPVEVDQVQLLERCAVALLAALDELADLRARGTLLRRLGHSKKGCPAA